MKILFSFNILVMLLLIFPFYSFSNENYKEVVKSICLESFNRSDADLKKNLLDLSKRAAVEELFGEIVKSSTFLKNGLLESDYVQTFSSGLVRIKGDPKYFQGNEFGQVCVKVTCYANKNDFQKYKPKKIKKKSCIAEGNVKLIKTKAKDQAKRKALTDYEPRLQRYDSELIFPLLHDIRIINEEFISDASVYCVQIEATVYPIEILSFNKSNLEVGRKNQEELASNKVREVKEIIKYSHTISVKGSNGISLRTRVLDKNELYELKTQKIDDNTYITTLENGHKIQILSKISNWYKVKTRINGNIKQGYISAYFKKIPTVKNIDTFNLWKGKWNTSWKNPMSYNSKYGQLLEFNNDISTFLGSYTYISKEKQTIEGKIFNIEFNGNNLLGEWIEKSSNGNEISKGNLEFLMFSDNNSFIGRFSRKYEAKNIYRYWKGERKID